jgi:hypothetical protein
MAIKHKGHFVLGLFLFFSFAVVLVLMFSPIFPKTKAGEPQNGLQWSDEMFNNLAKGSSYFIPRIAKNIDQFKGRMFSATFKMGKPEDKPGDAEKRALRSAVILAAAGAKVEVKGEELKVIEGDLGKILEAAIRDSETMFKNEGDKLKALYAADMKTDDIKQIYRQWNNTLPKMSKQFEKEKKMEERKICADVVKKCIEAAYNFYGVDAVKVKDHIGLMAFLLIFYVTYTMWWGFAIFYLFEAIGLSMKKAKVKKEV